MQGSNPPRGYDYDEQITRPGDDQEPIVTRSARGRPVGVIHVAEHVCGVVLAAGLGTRLRPATNITPKPAVPFMGLPIALHSVNALAKAGVTRFGANVHYHPEVMAEALSPIRDAGFMLAISREDGEILGTGGGVREIWKRVGIDKTLVICHGDVVLNVDLDEVLAAHRAADAPVTLVLKVRDGSISLRGVFADETGRVTRILDHIATGAIGESQEYAFTGIQVLEPEVYPMLAAHGPYCLVTELYPALLAAGREITSYRTEAFYADLGTYERFLTAQKAVFDDPDRLANMVWPHEHAPGIFVEESVTVQPGAELQGPVLLRGDVVVEGGAQVGPYAVVSGDVALGPRAHTRNAAIWGQGRLDERAHDGLFAITSATGENA